MADEFNRSVIEGQWIDDASMRRFSKDEMDRLEVVERDDTRDRIKVRPRGPARSAFTQRGANFQMMSAREAADRLRQFSNDHVIIWMSGRFTYAAVSVRGMWYTTAAENNDHFGQKVNSDELALSMVRWDVHEVHIVRNTEMI